MINFRKYGEPPFNVVVVHGGPGAAGEMKPLAMELSQIHGVLEPLQTASSVKSQVQELSDVIRRHADSPVRIIGWSWGAWLSYMLAAGSPDLVDKLILVGSGAFEEGYALETMRTRINRMGDSELAELQALNRALNNPAAGNKDDLFQRLGCLFDGTDSYAAMDYETDSTMVNFSIYQSVWPEAAEMRRKGTLLKLASKILCPVVAIHGDYDPHPALGVTKPLRRNLKQFRFALLPKCGHKPWMEKEARDRFYSLLKKELAP
jgi:pimeloyl-ACP methyl ester carboxylesterase